MKVNVDAPAKINLFLDIRGKRSDGYHIVSMVMQSISLCDEITVSRTDDGDIKMRIFHLMKPIQYIRLLSFSLKKQKKKTRALRLRLRKIFRLRQDLAEEVQMQRQCFMH